MNREQETWRSMVIIAFAIVSIIVIVVAAFRSCQAEEPKESEPAPAVELVSDTDEFTEPVEDEPVAVECEIPPRTYIGSCRLTVYNADESHHGYNTATGATSAHLMTCAVDPKVIPYGSIVIIVDKDGEEHRFRAVDCGGFSGKWVDIFFDDTERHGIEWLDECFGGDFGEVWIEEPYCPTIEMLP